MKPSVSREHAFFAAAALLSLAVVWPLALPVATGMALAYVCERPVDWLLARARRSSDAWRWIAALLVQAVIAAVFLVPLTLFLLATLRQVPQLLDVSHNPLLAPGGQLRAIRSVSERLARIGLHVSPLSVQGQIQSGLLRVGQSLARGAGRVVSATPGSILDAFTMFMAWAVFLVHGRRWRARLVPRLLPWPAQREILSATLGDVLEAVILANVAVSAVQAMVVAVFLTLTETPSVLLWSGLAFFLSFVPVVGTAPVMLGAAAYAFGHGRTGAAVLLLFGSAVVGSIDNVLRPFLVKGRADLSFFWVFLAFVGGIAQFGLAGTVLGPFALALFVAALRAWEARDDETA